MAVPEKPYEAGKALHVKCACHGHCRPPSENHVFFCVVVKTWNERESLSKKMKKGKAQSRFPGTRSFFRKPFFRKFIMTPPQEVLGDERTNFGAYSILLG